MIPTEPGGGRHPDAPYRPIGDYALIGDCHGCALVSRDGSIDWAALKRFDADPVFCRILDAGRGGFWSICPAADYSVERAYLPGTNVLRTVFTTNEGQVALTDFMPVGRKLDAKVHDYVHLNAPGWIVRQLEGLHGDVRLNIRYRPSRAFAAKRVTLKAGKFGAQDERSQRVLRAGPDMPSLFGELAFDIEHDLANATVELREGERLELALADNMVEGEWPIARAQEFLQATLAFWTEWIAYCRYRGPHRAAVERSALALKLMTFAPSGAIVAAATTSLPESIGGGRNWDYRYCWPRDSSFALYALAVLGYGGEAKCFHDFLLRACAQTLPMIRPMYTIDGGAELDEAVLDHLEGYRQSAPVRTGNDAAHQCQMDVYGQALDLSYLYRTLGGKHDRQYQRLLSAVSKFVAAHWQEPDQGLWEARGAPRHYVHGKLMNWVAMDRAARLLDNAAAWRTLAQRIAAEIHAQGISPEHGGLQQAYDGGDDAAVLLAPMLGFPMLQVTLERTIDQVISSLRRGDYLARYAGEDGVDGEEGAFLVCSSWLIDAELACGRLAEAQARFARLLGCANDVGLYAEEIDPADSALLGNFPQALTHLGVIGNAANLQLAERHGARALAGSYADRARRVVTATFGWRAVLAAMWQSHRVGRVFSSKRSKLAWP